MRQLIVSIACLVAIALVAPSAAADTTTAEPSLGARWLRGHQDGILAIAFSPDGKSVVTGSADNTVRIWDRATGAERLKLSGHRDAVNCVAWSKDGKKIVSGGKDMTVRVWDAQTGDLLSRMARPQDHVHCMAVSADASRVVTGSCDGCVIVWDTVNEKVVWRLQRANRPHTVAISPDGKQVAFGCGFDADVALGAWQPGEDCFVIVCDTETGQELRRAELAHQCVQLFWSADGKRLATVSPKGFRLQRLLQIRDADTLKPISQIEVESILNEPFVLSPAFDRLLQHTPNSVSSPDMATGKPLKSWAAGDHLHAVAISDDGKWVAWGGGGSGSVYSRSSKQDIGELWHPTGDNDGQIFELDRPVAQRIALAALEGPLATGMGAVPTSISPARDGSSVTIGYWTGTLRQFRTSDGVLLHTIVPADPQATQHLSAIAQSSDGRQFAAVYMNSSLRLYDVDSAKEIRCIKASESKLQWGTTAFSPDGKFICAGFWGGSSKGGVWMFDAQSGAEVRHFSLAPQRIGHILFTSDAQRLVVVERGGHGLRAGSDHHPIAAHATVFEVATGKVLRELDLHSDTVLAADLVDNRIAAIAVSREVHFWNLDTGTDPIAPMFSRRAETLATEPDGKTVLAVGDGDRALRIDPNTGLVRKELSIPGHPVGGNPGRLIFMPHSGPYLLTNGRVMEPLLAE